MLNRLSATLIAGLVGVSLSVTACAGPNDSSADDQNNGNDEQTSGDGGFSLRMVIFSSNPAHMEILEGIADDYVATTDTGVEEVRFEVVPAADLVTVLTTQLSSGDVPDISWLQDLNSAAFIDSGALIDLAPQLKDDLDFDYDDLIQSAMEVWKRDDSLYAVPFSTSPLGMYVNVDLFRAAGLPSPAEMIEAGTWNWEEFRAAAKAITDSQGVPGFVVDGFEFQRWDKLVPIWNAFGAEPWDETATQCTMNSPEMVEAMTFFHEMVYVDGSHPLPGQSADFWGGTAGATPVFISSAQLLEGATFEWDFVPLPDGPVGEYATLGQSALVAYANSPHPDEAVDFLAFMANKENMARLAAYFVPIRESLLNVETLGEGNPLLSKEQLANVVIDRLPIGKTLPISNDPGLVSSTLNASLDQHLWVENADVPAALDAVCGDLSAVLSE